MNDDEARRVRDVYARRAERGLDNRYAYWEKANLFTYQSRERALLDLLRGASLLPLTGRRILDVGCGDGSVLRDLTRYGVDQDDLYGVDLLPDRVRHAQQTLPAAHIEVGNALALPYDDACFDLVLAYTVLSSVLDDAARRALVAEIQRVARPGGQVMIYDFWINPGNRDARALRRSDVVALFPGKAIRFKGMTLAPPLTRYLVNLPGGWLACSALEVIPFLRTHFLAAVTI